MAARPGWRPTRDRWHTVSLLVSSLAILGGLTAVTGVLALYVIGKVTAHLVSEEVDGRINQLGYALLHLVCRRLPKDLREVYYEFWAADLDAYYQKAEHRPLTRLFWSLGFPLPLLFTGRKVARIMDPKSFEVKKTTGVKNTIPPRIIKAIRSEYALVACGMSAVTGSTTAAVLWATGENGPPSWWWAASVGGGLVNVVVAVAIGLRARRNAYRRLKAKSISR